MHGHAHWQVATASVVHECADTRAMFGSITDAQSSQIRNAACASSVLFRILQEATCIKMTSQFSSSPFKDIRVRNPCKASKKSERHSYSKPSGGEKMLTKGEEKIFTYNLCQFRRDWDHHDNFTCDPAVVIEIQMQLVLGLCLSFHMWKTAARFSLRPAHSEARSMVKIVKETWCICAFARLR